MKHRWLHPLQDFAETLTGKFIAGYCFLVAAGAYLGGRDREWGTFYLTGIFLAALISAPVTVYRYSTLRSPHAVIARLWAVYGVVYALLIYGFWTFATGRNPTTMPSKPIITEFAPPSRSAPEEVTEDREGNIWFTEVHRGAIGVLHVDGSFGEYQLPNPHEQLTEIAAGAFDDIWFLAYQRNNADHTVRFSDDLGTLDHLRHVHNYLLRSLRPVLGAIIVDGLLPTYSVNGGFGRVERRISIDGGPLHPRGPNNALTSCDADERARTAWLVGALFGRRTTTLHPAIGMPADCSRETALPLASAPRNVTQDPQVTGFAVGRNHRLWFTSMAPDRIGYVDQDDNIHMFNFPDTTIHGLSRIVSGADGDMWFTESENDAIGRISEDGIIKEFHLPTLGSRPFGIAQGSDHAIWFTEPDANSLGRIDHDGRITEYPMSNPGQNPWEMTTGSDHALWVSEPRAGKLARVRIP